MSNDDHIIIQILCHNRGLGLHVQSQWHIRAYISQSYNHNLYVQYVHLCGVHFSITYHINTIEEILYSSVTMIIYIYNIYIYVESISLSHMTLWYYDNLVYIFVGTTVSLIFCFILKYICINPSTFLHVCRYLLCNHWYNIVFFIIIDPFPAWISWNYFFLCGRCP